jgi:hypothetical protein
MLVLAVVVFGLASAAALGATQLTGSTGVRLTRHVLVSSSFRVDERVHVPAVPIATRLSCTQQAGALACRPVSQPVSSTPPYRLAALASSRTGGVRMTVWMFATGTSVFSAVQGLPPVIACPLPSARTLQICSPLVAHSVLPLGTPIYQNVER